MRFLVAFYLIICLYISIKYYSDIITKIFHDLIIYNIRKKKIISILYTFLGICGFLILIPILFCIFPFTLLYRLALEKREGKAKYVSSYNPSEDNSRTYNAAYDKLFFSLINKYSGPETEQVRAFKALFSQFEIIAFPIIYNYGLEYERVFKSNFRHKFNDQKVALFIFDTAKYFDPVGESSQTVFSAISNTNYSMRTSDKEISAAALASIMNIEIDGINKIVFCKKENLKKLYIVNINDLNIDKLGDILYDLDKLEKILLSNNIYFQISNYLALNWTNSKAEENHYLRESAKKIREDLYTECRNASKSELINIYKIVGYRPPQIYYSLGKQSDEEKIIRNLTLTVPLIELHKKYPSYDLETLKLFKSNVIKHKIWEIGEEPLIDYKSKIFLKSSSKILSIFDNDEIDFSAVTIGYSKFFEREFNLSGVQLIRKELGIFMPTFYQKYCTNYGNYFVVGKNSFKVNFNMLNKTTNEYLPPGLGQSLISFEIILSKFNTRLKRHQLIISKGKLLNTIRNKSAHPDLINIDDVRQIQELIVELYIHGGLLELFELKNVLSR